VKQVIILDRQPYDIKKFFIFTTLTSMNLLHTITT